MLYTCALYNSNISTNDKNTLYEHHMHYNIGIYVCLPPWRFPLLLRNVPVHGRLCEIGLTHLARQPVHLQYMFMFRCVVSILLRCKYSICTSKVCLPCGGERCRGSQPGGWWSECRTNEWCIGVSILCLYMWLHNTATMTYCTWLILCTTHTYTLDSSSYFLLVS